MDEPLGTSPPLELRRVAGQRVAVPHSLQSPQDRATGNLKKKIDLSYADFDQYNYISKFKF